MIDRYVMKKARFTWFFFALSLVVLSSQSASAELYLSTFLNYDIQTQDQTVLFRFLGGNANSISQLRVHYLTSSDCQSGYIGFQNSVINSHDFKLEHNKIFGLGANAVYKAAIEASNIVEVERIHSILIRFISTNGRFAWFTSSCNDESINCCVPVYCSNAIGSCLPQQILAVQDFVT